MYAFPCYDAKNTWTYFKSCYILVWRTKLHVVFSKYIMLRGNHYWKHKLLIFEEIGTVTRLEVKIKNSLYDLIALARIYKDFNPTEVSKWALVISVSIF